MKSIHIVLCLTKWRDIFKTSQNGLGYDFNKNTKDRNENDTWSKIRQNEKKIISLSTAIRFIYLLLSCLMD